MSMSAPTVDAVIARVTNGAMEGQRHDLKREVHGAVLAALTAHRRQDAAERDRWLGLAWKTLDQLEGVR